MASRRTKSIGTKVTPEEYARIQTLAGEQPVSEWVRVALLKAATDPAAADSIVLAELLALRDPAQSPLPSVQRHATHRGDHAASDRTR